MKKSFTWIFTVLFLSVFFSPAYAAKDSANSSKKEVKTSINKEEKIEKIPKFPKGIWLNTPPLTKKYFDGRVTLLYFWDYSSINCIREIREIKKLQRTYRPFGLRVIWVHAPEFKFAADPANAREAIRRFGITQPVFLDNDFKLWESYHVRSWPTKILINKDREIAHTFVGEENLRKTEAEIRNLIKGMDPEAALPAMILKKEKEGFASPICGVMSGETYVGYKRAGWWGARVANQDWVSKDKPVLFKDRGQRVERGFFLNGLWENREDDFKHSRETSELTDYLGLIYLGNEVYSMLNSSEKEGSKVYVTRDENPVPPEFRGQDMREDKEGRTYVLVDQPRLYYLISNEDSEPHEIKVWTQSKDVTVQSFSFSNQCLSDFDHR